jgi:hypothetical protein
MLRASAATSSKNENWTDSQNFNICNHNYKATSLQYYNLCSKLDNSREKKHLNLLMQIAATQSPFVAPDD